MTAQELAALLHGREIGDEITDDEEAQAKAAGLVVVFGYSDDNVELCGAIHDEIGAYEGTTFRVCADGLLPHWPDRHDEAWEEKQAEAYFKRKAAGFQEIEALWCDPASQSESESDLAWTYKTDIPHATFDILEAGSVWCRGIVFALADVKPAVTV